MKKFLLASVGILALGVVAASAADLPRQQRCRRRRRSTCRRPGAGPGFYVGINGGGGFGRSDFCRALPHRLVRYVRRTGRRHARLQLSDGPTSCSASKATSTGAISAAAPPAPAPACETRNNWLGTARGRLGYAFGNFMPYVTGGLAVGDIKTSIAGVGERERNQGRLDRRAAASRRTSAAHGRPRSNISMSISAAAPRCSGRMPNSRPTSCAPV